MTFPTFAEFFKAATGHDPYVWQQELAEHLREHGRWPWLIDVATGLGKTSCIDVAVYELARQAHTGGPRTAPQRIFHVVDRRTIIDSAVDYAQVLARRVSEATVGPLVPIRAALSGLEPAGSDEVIHVTGIHGQDADDHQWMQRVTGCTIVSLTSHQFISRLLLRGYGVSPGIRPVAAALCAVDRLVLFDEPHLSPQAVHTILAAERLQDRAAEHLGLPRPSTVLLGATVPSYLTNLGVDSIRVVAEREDDAAIQRLRALRPVAVKWVNGTDSATSGALVAAACQLVKSGARRTVVFVNTVAMAQEVYSALSGKLDASDSPVPVRLTTSRFRPWDKARKEDLEGPGVVVATQTLEVGVDLSFDSLVTEVCPWSSMLQRLGRFNRYGEFNADEQFRRRKAVVVAGWNATSGEPSPRRASVYVYGTESLNACAAVLRSLTVDQGEGTADLGPSGIEDIVPDEGRLEPVEPRIGTLTSAMLPLIAQTRPTPEADIPVDALISGPDAEASDDVELAWRHHLDAFDLPDVDLTVSPAEVVTIPRSAWAAFLARNEKSTANLHDVEAAAEQSDAAPLAVPRVDDLHLYRIWQPTDGTWRVPPSARQLVRASRVVMSPVLGGYTSQLGWTGSHGKEPGLDISWDAAVDDLHRLRPGRTVDLILHRDRPDRDESKEAEDLIEAFDDIQDQLTSGIDRDDLDVDVVVKASESYVRWQISAVDEASEEAHTPGVRPVSKQDTRISIMLADNPQVVVARVQVKPTRHGRAVPLEEHQMQVGTWAGNDAATVGLDPELVAEITYAGMHHDDGKRLPAFQRYLLADNPSGAGPVAKSTWAYLSAQEDRRRRAEAGVPGGFRHEAESVMYLGGCSALVRHLAGSHHGWFRPVMPPAVCSTDATGYPMLTEHGDDFDRLNERFGVWGLAYLESFVRMADWRASASPRDTPQMPRPTPKSPPASPSRVDSSPLPRAAYSFSGLHTHPMTGWFAAVGLLAAARDTDPGARVHWEPLLSDPVGTPMVPVLTTSEEPQQLVRRVIGSSSWQSVLDLTNGVLTSGGLTAKAQKVGPASGLHDLLESAEGQRAELFTALINDLAHTETSSNDKSSSKVPLAMAPFANNASYVAVAFARASRRRGVRTRAVDEAVDALTRIGAGFSNDKCDGGMDRNLAEAPGVNGLGDPVTRLSRSALAPLALYGMASLGTGPLKGMGVVAADEISLPLPLTGLTFSQLRALTYLGRVHPRWDWTSAGLEWIYLAKRRVLSKYESVWDGWARLRGSGQRA